MKIILITLLIALVVIEIIEHILAPLVGLMLNRKKVSISGAEGMIGKVVKVRTWKVTEGKVFVNGEIWKAVCRVPLAQGDEAIIQKVNGLTLEVVPHRD